ncbi:AzlD domain-containing protein [Paraneptunicella aestuarii]|uniref:AzlD domain-containing protein n=1 Tax=Paraneptunicella aestuarii TaxID=2831148 RepID=UPI001E518E87|nr:AzlD domain-containing protein [Paraneptunicella aestuarii]UAA37383.1 AzlD domain-containing protein [Paraneptunicella aestuarii]
MSEWLLIVGMSIVTFIPRFLPMALANRLNLPKTVVQALSYVPVAVLTIIVVQSSLFHNGKLNLALDNGYIWAAITAMLFTFIQPRLLLSIVAGMAAYLLVKFGLT